MHFVFSKLIAYFNRSRFSNSQAQLFKEPLVSRGTIDLVQFPKTPLFSHLFFSYTCKNSQLFCPWFFFTISFIAIGFALSFSPQFHKTQLVLPLLFFPHSTNHNWLDNLFYFTIARNAIGKTIGFILPWQLHNFCNSWFFLTIWTNCFYQC